MWKRQEHLNEIDREELGIEEGTIAERTALEYIPYWSADPRYPYNYCACEELLQRIITPVKEYRYWALAISVMRDKEFFIKGYEAAIRDVVNLMKMENIFEVDETDCAPDDLSPFGL